MARPRPYFKPWTTPTGLLLYMQKEEAGFTVCLAGDRVKELLTTPDRRAASEYAWKVRDQYDG